MAKCNDLTGQRFGKLTVIEYFGVSKNRKALWLCKCECGCIPNPVVGSNLLRGVTKSCGCLRKDTNKEHAKYNNQKHRRLYSIWHGMKQRCYWEKYKQYKDYGGRGIGVCEEWKNDFESFCTWAMSNGYQEYLTIDRIDPDGNYEPSNCRWATKEEQNRNKRKKLAKVEMFVT